MNAFKHPSTDFNFVVKVNLLIRHSIEQLKKIKSSNGLLGINILDIN